MSEEEKNIIKINRKKLSVKEIQENENFEGILNKHRMATKRPVYKQKKFYFFLFLLMLITLLIYYTDKEEKQKEAEKTEKTN
ncbi:MAG: hypothetical protein JKX68_14000 [Flavobacteriales bacterium]|nr:hypothetical protein [Flavobacteriales bacterium]